MGDLQGLDAITGPASHEFIEAVTDPFPMSDPAYAILDNAHIYWLRALGGAETGDMCAQNPGVFTAFSPDIDYVVQRSWSNKSATAGHDPCVPALPGSVYFNSAPVLDDTVAYHIAGQTINVKGVNIPVGASGVVELDLFSDGPTSGPWTVEAVDFSSAFNGGNPHLAFSLDRDSGVNGEKLHLTITVNSTGKNGTALFYLVSTLGTQKNIWVGVVGS